MNKLLSTILTLTFFATLAGCGGSGSNTAATSSTNMSMTGVVATPEAVSAQASAARFMARILASVGLVVTDSNPGVAAVGSGVTVNLIQIDSSGTQIGSVIATTTTDNNGNYTLSVPANFTPGPSYVVQAVTDSATIQSFATSTTVTVDPYTQATVSLVTGTVGATGSTIATITSATISAVQETVLISAGNVSTTSTSTTALVTALQQAVTNDVESNNIVTSITAKGGITGTVLDPNGAPVVGAQILVRTFGNQVTQATVRTAGDGTYTVPVPAGSYIVGVMNDTTTSAAASAWWSAAGNQVSQFKADKVTVGSSLITANFNLIAGGRLTGTITASDTGNPLPGIQATLCDFASGQTLMFVKTLPTGVVTFNVSPGTYYISMRNYTLQPYASQEVGGSNVMTGAQKITVTAGSSQQGAMTLMPGHLLSGTVSDPTTGPVTGMVVRFQDYSAHGASAESVRTDNNGNYGMWLRPGAYNVLTRGQEVSHISLVAGSVVQNFNAAVGQITMLLQDTNSHPLSQVFAYLFDGTTNNQLSFEVSNSDGSVTLFTTGSTKSVIVNFVVDDGEFIGTSTYSAASTASGVPIANGLVVPAPAAGNPISTNLGNITLPAGAILQGVATVGGVPTGNVMIQVRVNGTTNAARLVTERTRSDGSYQISLPAGATLSQVIAYNAGLGFSALAGSSGVPGYIGVGSGPNNYEYFDSVLLTGAVIQNFAY